MTVAGGRVAAVRRDRSVRRGVQSLAAVAVATLGVFVALGVTGSLLAAMNGFAAGRIGAAQQRAGDLLTAMTTQDVAIQAYANAGVPEFLDGYAGARTQTDTALRALASDDAESAHAPLVGQVTAEARRWQSWAEGVRTQVSDSGPVRDQATLTTGRELFDAFRADQAALLQELRGDLAAMVSASQRAGELAAAAMLGGSIAASIATLLLVRRVLRQVLDPVVALATTARRIAAGERVTIARRPVADEIGELTEALRGWQVASAEHAILSEQAPVGICRLDALGRMTDVNEAAAAMLGADREDLVGRPFTEVVHPDDRAHEQMAFREMVEGQVTSHTIENRWLRGDGSSMWCSVAVAKLLGPDRWPAGFVLILEDISDRKRQIERAARIQQELLPRAVPTMPGYELAGACLAAQDVAGDFYDWVVTERGELDLTVADVMGKGIGAALMMASLRSALRSAPAELGPAERMRVVARTMALDTGDDGMFVTVFHGRLDVRTGELRYVDAGHGYCAIRRAGGEFTTLPERSLPLGALGGVGGPGGSAGVGGEDFREGRMKLDPGDTLIVHSDGLVEIADQGPAELRMYERDLERAEDAEDAVRRLLGRMPARLPDDVTLVVLRRLAAGKIGAVA